MIFAFLFLTYFALYTIYRFSAITINGVFHGTRTKRSTICMETQKTLNSQTILRRKMNWSNQAPRAQITSQSHSNQDCMAPAQKTKTQTNGTR